MYELQKVDQTILNDYYTVITKALGKKQIPIILKACELAIRKDLPNAPKYIITPIINKLRDTLLQNSRFKIMEFDSEKEAINLFNKIYKKEYKKIRNKEETIEFENLYNKTYDLIKFDKKIKFNRYECFFNISFLREQYSIHQNAYWQWIDEANQKPNEMNINISHNTNKGIKNQTKFLKSQYKLSNATFGNNLERDMEQHIIHCAEENRHMMIRSIQEINSLSYDIKKIKNDDYQMAIKSFQKLSPHLNSDRPIDKNMIVKSWLTNIANLYKCVNPKKIPMTELSEYIDIVSKATTTIFRGNAVKKLYSPKILRDASFREVATYENFRLMEITDNRYKLSHTEEGIKDTENYLNNVTHYLKKLSKN